MRAPIAMGCRKSKGVLWHVLQFSGGNERHVHRSELAGEQRELVLQDIAVALPGKIEVRMVRQIEYGIFVRRRGVINLHRVLIGQQCVDDLYVEIPREAFLAIFAK